MTGFQIKMKNLWNISLKLFSKELNPLGTGSAEKQCQRQQRDTECALLLRSAWKKNNVKVYFYLITMVLLRLLHTKFE
jgi:hypothetical protein